MCRPVNSLGPLEDASTGAVRYYSLARFAFLEALRLWGVGQGQRVLLPSFICRDLLAPVALLGATPCWYDVGPALAPMEPPEAWPEASVVLAANYFGFPQELAPFIAYAERTGARVLEDNAHGYLSRDRRGRWLGTRAPFGLLSFRKTLRVPDGAALLCNDPDLAKVVPAQIPSNGEGIQSAQSIKTRLRRIPLIGSALLRMATTVVRMRRMQKTGSAVPLLDPLSESNIPFSPNPWSGLLSAISQTDGQAEIARRRALYVECAQQGERYRVDPVFPSLPELCAPYGYPFRGGVSGISAMQRVADRMRFDLVTWPDLPEAVWQTAPAHYRNVHLINFLW